MLNWSGLWTLVLQNSNLSNCRSLPNVVSDERTQIKKNGLSIKLAIKLDWTNTLYSREEIYSEYLYFLRNLPNLLHKEREKIIDNVKKKLKISEIETDLPNLNKDNLIGIREGGNLLDKLSIHLGYSLKFITPPVTHCLLCKEELKVHHKPTQVAVFGLGGPEVYSKYILRCRDCRLCPREKFKSVNSDSRQDIWYHPDKYGNVITGWVHYKQHKSEFVKSSNEVFFKRDCLDSYIRELSILNRLL